jgi:hypothetical protein
LPVDSEDYIAHIIHTSATIRQKPGNVEHTWQSLLHHCWLCIEVGGQYRSICSKLLTNTTLLRILQWFCLISNLSQTHSDGHYTGTARTHAWHI